MTSTTMPTIRKIEIIDKAIEILKSGGTTFADWFHSSEYRTRYTCHALAAVELHDGKIITGDLAFNRSLVVRDFVAFSAEVFGMVPYEDFSGINWEETKDGANPDWWNSSLPWVEERVKHLENFKQHLAGELE